MEVKGHWSNHTEAIISALPEETDNVKLFGSYLGGTNLISMLLNYILTVDYLTENTCRKSTSLPVMHLHMWFLGLLNKWINAELHSFVTLNPTNQQKPWSKQLMRFWTLRASVVLVLLLMTRTTFHFYQTKAAAECLLDHSYKNSFLFPYSFSWALFLQLERSLVVIEKNESRSQSRADINSQVQYSHYFSLFSHQLDNNNKKIKLTFVWILPRTFY